MRKGIIYKATCSVSGKSYVGQSVQTLTAVRGRHKREARDIKRRGYKSAFANAIRKHGWDSFLWEIIESGINREDLDSHEINAIACHGTRSPRGYNLTDGGEGRKGCQPWNKGKKHSIETIEKLRHAALNRSAEVRKTMSDAQKRRSPEVQERMNMTRAKTMRVVMNSEFWKKHKAAMRRPKTRAKMRASAITRILRLGHCAGKKLVSFRGE